MTNVDMMKANASSLTEEERAELAQHFLSTLDDPNQLDSVQWESDLSRRIAEIRAGTAKGRDLDEVMKDLEKRYP